MNSQEIIIATFLGILIVSVAVVIYKINKDSDE